MSFSDLGLAEPLVRAVTEHGYTIPTPIQLQAIPAVLNGGDLLAGAQTGTGKTAGFVLPLLQRLTLSVVAKPSTHKIVRCLILTPTRELAAQVEESVRIYGKHTKLTSTVIFGGVSQLNQTNILRRGVDILVATPGRLLDLISQGFIDLRYLKIFVLDEADRMLDMGFIHDVKRIITKLPAKRQTLFFSATMPPEIQKLANVLLTNPAKVEVTPPASTVDAIEQSLFYVDKKDKASLLLHLLKDNAIINALVFTRTKHGADKVVKFLHHAHITAAAIHGNKSQNARQDALGNFKNGKTRVLVATDIAARGIDIDELSHVINFELPDVPETYVHRIGRTGRAGNSGIAISFCDAEEREALRDIQKLIGKPVPVVSGHPFPHSNVVVLQRPPQSARAAGNRSRNFGSAGRNPRQGYGNRR